ncbi:MAG: MBOAT family protein [Phaeospirillum sp.]|nr:MBOAT family protein [Phaeospirillum sp.]
MTGVSLFFYGWFKPVYVLILMGSIVFNYLVGLTISADRAAGRRRGWVLVGAIAANLGFLGYFKYTNLLVTSANQLLGKSWEIEAILLPLAISFHTFQQIAYLVDIQKGKCEEHSFLNYCLFVTFFPQLIAGPIVHHNEMMPQLRRPVNRGFLSPWTSLGLTVFAVGLFKKSGIADTFALYADTVFDAAAQGGRISLIEAWGGALSYTFQIYFDFSGYSDMAIGLGLLFGVRLPINFNSPYKSISIIEFWRRWHITLSRFLRDYLYIPLGGNRFGPLRRSTNLMITMLLGGLWHGANWTFLAWGGLHGSYLLLNHLWRTTTGRAAPSSPLGRAVGWGLTFLAVVVAWVFFRAASFEAAFVVIKGMAGLNGVALPSVILAQAGALGETLGRWGVEALPGKMPYFFGATEIAALAGALAVCLLLPNVNEALIRRRRGRAGGRAWTLWREAPLWAVAGGAAAAFSLFGVMRENSFIYFQF